MRAKSQLTNVHGSYLRDDGMLMLEVEPGRFISETAIRLGLAHPNLLTDIGRIKATLPRPPAKKNSKLTRPRD